VDSRGRGVKVVTAGFVSEVEAGPRLAVDQNGRVAPRAAVIEVHDKRHKAFPLSAYTSTEMVVRLYDRVKSGVEKSDLTGGS
jgi:hypothetical protein